MYKVAICCCVILLAACEPSHKQECEDAIRRAEASLTLLTTTVREFPLVAERSECAGLAQAFRDATKTTETASAICMMADQNAMIMMLDALVIIATVREGFIDRCGWMTNSRRSLSCGDELWVKASFNKVLR